jgi:hypothetical protein
MAITRTYIGRAKYDYDVDGGAADTAITPANNFTLPVGAMIIGAWTDVKTNMTSGGSAEVALAIGGVTIKTATAFNNAAYTGIDYHLARTSAALTTALGSVTFTTSGSAALTAGEVDIYVEYLLPD